ncbi:MAG: insecticidal toxin protein, partial [Planctomycetaceae bacterium]|nr:insecticidal toxin protein [Planctomycetaceae bacterium]
QRFMYYEKLLGKKEAEIKIPELDALDNDGLKNMKFKSSEAKLEPHGIDVDIAQDLGASGGKLISSHEADELESLSEAQSWLDGAAVAEGIAAGLSLIPQIGGKIQPLGAGVDITIGGVQLSSLLTIGASVSRAIAARNNYEANKASKIGSYARREQDWAFQSNLAAGEITQIFKQIRAAQIREAITEREWKNHQQQMRHAEDVEHFLSGEKNSSGHQKTSTQAFYAWMKREVKGLYAQVFQFAFDIAKKAERALQHELGNPDLSYLQFGYLAGKEGLFAGEKLYLDIKRMEMAYHDLNQREYELTKHVSLLQVNPMALLQLRATGFCTVLLAEELFDMDGPGHYFRRIKTVSISIPCVSGPHTSVNCTLTMLKSSIRKNSSLVGNIYAREGAEDGRFSDHFGSLQSIVTSSGQNDSGLFETNLRDERYLPFEGSGVVSEWQLQLPAEIRQFDYNTIADVIVHLRYTAREGGGLLRNEAVANLTTLINSAQATGSVRLLSIRHEFPSEWAKFQNQPPSQRYELVLNLRLEHYPFWSQNRNVSVKRVDLVARSSIKPPPLNMKIFETIDARAKETTLTKVAALGDLLVGNSTGADTEIPLPNPVGELKLYLDNRSLENLWIAISWGQG